MKTLLLFLITFLSGITYSQVTFSHIPPKRENFIELNEILQLGGRLQNFTRTEFLLYPSVIRFCPTIKELNYGLGIGINNSSKEIYGKTKVLYYWLPKYKLGTEIFINSENKFKNVSLGFNVRKDFKIFYFKGEDYNVNIFTGLTYNSFFKSTTYDIGLGLSLVNVTYYKKPVIYIYTKDTIQLDIKIDFKGEFTFTWPKYTDKWCVTVYPNSEIVDNNSKKRFKYLFWEGNYKRPNKDTINTGFIVERKDLIEFLPEKLEQIGLTDIEINDFVTYWIPMLQKEKYLIHFITNTDCDLIAKYEFSQEPSSLIRVIALFIETEKIEINEQKLKKNERTDFTIVEWGGTEY